MGSILTFSLVSVWQMASFFSDLLGLNTGIFPGIFSVYSCCGSQQQHSLPVLILMFSYVLNV